MRIHMQQLRRLKGPMVLDDTLDVSDVANPGHQIESVDLLECHVEAVLTGDVCYVTGRVATTVTYLCSRCLEPFKQYVVSELEQAFSDESNCLNDDVLEIVDGDIELQPFLREALFLVLDFHPECTEGCLGLCSTCGCNRNTTTCSCDLGVVDPRLAGLSDLLSAHDSE